MTHASMEALPENVRRCINMSRYKTEAEWLRTGVPAPAQRVLRLVLEEENIAHWESVSPTQLVGELEALDDACRAAFPPMESLARLYGDPDGQRLYQGRDLRWKWQSRWRKENNVQTCDATDERKTGSVWI